MKKLLSFLVLFWGLSVAMAQKTIIPEVKVVSEDNVHPMQLQDLSVDILVVGQTAVTTMEMTFYNPNNRVMEGEFEFPLAEGQQVSRFALDIDGKLREGVVVDKSLGRKAFEDIVRRGVDPGLLEKTEGNNFRARVYPMPRKGSRRILIAFEQELSQKNGQDFYFLPIANAAKLKKFKIRTEVVSRFVKADIQNSLQLDFTQSRNSYLSEVEKTNFTLNKNIALLFPKIDKPQLLTASQGDKSYLYGNIALEKQELRAKEAPKTLGILWDVSSSSEKRDFAKEYMLLDSYFKEVKNIKVVLTTFHIYASKPISFEIKEGNWQALKDHLDKLTYDGATDGNAMTFPAGADEYFLFSNGIFNFGKEAFQINNLVKRLHAPVCVITSELVANMDKLQYLAGATGGSFINLSSQELLDAVKALRYQSFQLLGYRVKSGNVTDLYPQKGALVGENFTFSGELNSDEATLVVSLGYSGKVVVEKEVTFSKNNSASAGEFALLRRIWAEKKITQLQREGAQAKEIDAVGRQYGIVTEGNSLIVLETVADYVRYQITPPEEFQREYNRLVNTEKQNKEKTKKAHLDHIVKLSETQSKWWNTSFPIAGTKPVKNTADQSSNESTAGINARASASTLVIRGIGSISESSQAEMAEVSVGYSRSLGYSRSSRKERRAAKKPALQARSADNYHEQSEDYEDRSGELANTSKITLNNYNPDTPYLKVMEYADPAKAIETYYKLKKEYGQTPSFYVDVADYFFKKGDTEQAVLVVSNLAELGLEDAQLLRVLGYKLSSYKAHKEAIEVFRKVLSIREEEPQSYRDLGQALAQGGEYQQAVETLYKVVERPWDGRFRDVQLIVMNEINDLVNTQKGIRTSFIDKRLLKKEPVDIRVVLTWDTDNSDMDLWVTDPEDEKCYYGHRQTYLGGIISQDVTGGYGPEEFMLKKAPKGTYKIAVNYYGNRSQKQLFPVSLRITFFTHYGTPQEKKQETTVRLSNQREVIEVGSFEF
ncbi:VIT domain-containing protein [Capnocytophaga gingivalis]|uniref:VIT domain-containing protein n=1 Tax=Capnocytophaga gingivalis TaxID=1017 RepID=UPI0028D8353F|nr:VIT domain-containing protein [Capnocytophaga gingivalis]